MPRATRSCSSAGAADGEPTAQDWAAATGTINYEIVTRIGARVPRVVLGGAEPREPAPGNTALGLGLGLAAAGAATAAGVAADRLTRAAAPPCRP